MYSFAAKKKKNYNNNTRIHAGSPQRAFINVSIYTYNIRTLMHIECRTIERLIKLEPSDYLQRTRIILIHRYILY